MCAIGNVYVMVIMSLMFVLLKQLLAEWIGTIGTIILRVCLMWHCISVSQKVREEDSVRDGENNTEFSKFAYYYCCYVIIIIIIIIIINILSQLKSMNCHLGKYALFHVYSRADCASLGGTICEWIKMYTMLILTNFNVIVQLLVSVFRAQEASQNVVLFCESRKWKMGACEKIWTWWKWSGKWRTLCTERLQENVGCSLQVVCCKRLILEQAFQSVCNVLIKIFIFMIWTQISMFSNPVDARCGTSQHWQPYRLQTQLCVQLTSHDHILQHSWKSG
jgi:hypothetical protein